MLTVQRRSECLAPTKAVNKARAAGRSSCTPNKLLTLVTWQHHVLGGNDWQAVVLLYGAQLSGYRGMHA